MACCGVRGNNRVKIIQKIFRNLHWLSTQAVSQQKRRHFAALVVSRSLYQEHRRTYKVSLPDLYRVIQNECKILSRPGVVIVWMVLPKSQDGYEVLYASIVRSLLSTHPASLQMVVPETWLFYRNLQTNVLYQVDAEQQYWAYLSQTGTLHVTTQQGLMAKASNFLEALGANVADVQRYTLAIPDYFHRTELNLHWWQLAGLLCLPERSAQPLELSRYKKFGKLTAITLVGYMVVVSAGLHLRQSWLEEKVDELKKSASALVDEQNALDEQLLLINNYNKLISAQVSYSNLMLDLATQLKGIAEIDDISVVDNLVTLRGKSKSATEVLSRLAEAENWQESRFTQPVRTSENSDSFTIATMYVPKTPAVSVAPAEATTQEVKP